MGRLNSRILFFVLAITLADDCISDDVLREKIVIVGGGAAGIAAASKLLQNGYENIVILEAENRIGGRIWTECAADDCLELGAKWIMGERGNVAFELAEKAKIVGRKLEEYESLFFKSNGDTIDSNNIFSSWKLYDEIVATFDDRSETVAELFQDHIANMDSSDLDKDTLKNFFKLLTKSITPVTDWNLETGGGLRTFKTIEGSTAISLNTGMNAILQILMGTFPMSELSAKWNNIIRLGAKVNQISWNQQKPVVQYSTTAEPNKMETIEAEHVILTVPLGVLKAEYQTLFAPPLPEKKVNAINSLSFGLVNKVFFTFEQQWWPHNTNLFVIWNDNDILQLKASDKWLANIAGLFPEESSKNTLTAWFVEEGNENSETQTDQEVSTQLTSLIKNVFKNQGWNITTPVKSKRTKWHENPHFLGSYSYRGLDAAKAMITNADLRESLTNEQGKQTVLFAGEATNNEYYSSLHGAIESGYLAADAIGEIHRKL